MFATNRPLKLQINYKYKNISKPYYLNTLKDKITIVSNIKTRKENS